MLGGITGAIGSGVDAARQKLKDIGGYTGVPGIPTKKINPADIGRGAKAVVCKMVESTIALRSLASRANVLG